MEFFYLLWNIFAFVIMRTFEMAANVADEVMFTLEDYDVYGKIAKYLSFCIGNFYFWQALTTIGFCYYLRRLADRFPALPIITIDSPVHAGPSMQQLLEEKETALTDAASKIDNLELEEACLRAKVRRLESEVDFLSHDRYTLVREKITLENRLGDFNSWPEFRIEFDQITTEFIAMKRQRAREHVLQERYLEIARESRVELAAAKHAESMCKIAHSKELELVQQERDEAMEKYRTLLATTTITVATTTPAATTSPATTPAATAAAVAATTSPVANAAAAIPVVKGDSPGDIALRDENTRLTLALRSQSSLLSKKSSDLGRMQSLLKTRSDHSAIQLERASSTIASLEEDKAKAEAHIAELGRDLQEAKDRAEEMEDMYMAVAFASEGEGEKVEEEEDEEGSGGEKAETSFLLRQIVEMSKKGPAGGSGADKAGSEDEDEEENDDGDSDSDDDDDGDGDYDGDGEDDEEEDGGGEGDDEEEGEDKRIHDENEELFKDMMGLP